MTISTSQNSAVFLGNGATYSFDYSFVGASASYLSLLYTTAAGVTTTLNPSSYTVTLNAPVQGQEWGYGGTVTYPLVGSPIANGTSLTLVRTIPLQQLTSLTDNGNFYPQTIEQTFDLQEMQIQQISGEINAATNSAAYYAAQAEAAAITAATYAGINATNTFNGDGSTVAFTLSSTPGSINNTDVFISGVYQEKFNYTLSGDVLTFATAPATGTNNIEVMVNTSVTGGGGGTVSLTTNGTYGAATLTGSTLNIPQYSVSGFNSYIVTPIVPPAIPGSGFGVTLPAGVGVLNGVTMAIPAVSFTGSANQIVDYWLNTDGTWTIETQSTSTYTLLPHYSGKLHVWQVETDSSKISAITIMANTYPTVYRPNDIAGTADTFAELFYLLNTTTNWATTTAVVYGALLLTAAGNVYQVVVPGTTGGSAPTSTASGAITDGTATLNYYCQSGYLGMFRRGANNGTEYYFVNQALENVCHKTLLTGSPLGNPAGTTLASMVKTYMLGVFKNLIGNRVNLGTYAFGMKMIAGGYIWLCTTGGTAAGSSPFSGSYTPGTSTVTDGTITWKCIYVSYASQQWFWMDVDRTFLTYTYPDSHDSYASTFASLLSRYIQLTNDSSWMTGASTQPSGSGTYWTYAQVFGYIMNANLDTQISNFLTQTFQNNVAPWDGSAFTTQYLEDNCESSKGYREAAYVYGVLGNSSAQTAATNNAAYVGSGVASLYDPTYNLFATQYGQAVSSWANTITIGSYPYLQAQLFPELCNVGTINDDQFKLVRYNVSQFWNNYWQDKGLDSFPDSFIGFLASRSWQDTAKAYAFVEKFERYYINGGTVAQGNFYQGGGTSIADWGFYLATKDLLIAPLTVLNITGTTLNLLSQTGDVVSFSGGGGITRTITPVSTNTTAAAAANTDYVYLCSGTMTLTIPTAVSNKNRYTVCNVGTGVITIAFTGGQTGSGASTITLSNQYQSDDLISNNANWFVI